MLPHRPKAVNVALLAADSYDGVLEIFAAAKRDLGEILSAVELIDADSMTVNKNNMDLDNPLSEQPFYVLLETHGEEGSWFLYVTYIYISSGGIYIDIYISRALGGADLKLESAANQIAIVIHQTPLLTHQHTC